MFNRSSLFIFGLLALAPGSALADPWATFEGSATGAFDLDSEMIASGWGIWDDFNRNCGSTFSSFSPGLLSIYEDETPDMDARDPETFADGTMLLQGETGEFFSFWTESGYPCYVSSGTSLEFTDGILLGEIAGDFAPTGGFAYTYRFTDPRAQPFATIAGTLWLEPKTPTNTVSWGRLKARYP